MPFLALIAAYLIGGIPFGYLLVKLTTGQDVRASGSGNIGATNVLRTTGRAAGVATLLLDIAKGWFAVWLASKLTHGSVAWMAAAAFVVMIGHAYPVILKFKGGKAVATFVGAYLYLTPLPVLCVLVIFVAVVAVSRHISLGSIAGALTFPLAVWLILHAEAAVLWSSILSSALVIYRHKDNIRRLRAGHENVFRFGGSR